MKGFFKCLIVLLVIGLGVGGFFLYKNIKESARIKEAKKGWYVEVIHKEPINVREEPNTKGKIIGKAKVGGIYKAIDIKTDNSIYYWYKIILENGDEGWIASGKKIHWVNDANNKIDIATPEIKYYEDVYKVDSINDINYKHLEVVEDTDDYTITHKIYHEIKQSEFIDQYWILYTITDGAGKSSSKLQKIEFKENPPEEEVENFANYLAKK